MKKQDISALVAKQRAYFATGATLPVSARIRALRSLKREIVAREAAISEALRQDLGKSAFEGYMCEVGMVLEELSYMLSHVHQFARDRRVETPLAQFLSRSFKKPSPYGVTLIMSPWNYPFLLTLGPLVDALAAGNTAIVKPSAYSPATGAIVAELLATVFRPEYVATVTGGREENGYLLEEKFDYIFFTGSKEVGRTVLAKAAPHLTPVTLELGGKSPCIVDKSAKLRLAARRIVFGKYLNCGQTCVAPDYILCHEEVKDRLVEYICHEIRRQYGENPLVDPDYGKIINQKHFDRILGLIDEKKVVLGGRSDAALLKIEPTVMEGVTAEDAVMGEEIFGPLMPILTYRDTEEAIRFVRGGDKPLALYVFTGDKRVARRITTECAFGGGCINDTIIHLATSNMGFGGVGESGMGAYHGKAGFDAFSHYKSIVDKKTLIDLPMRYRPYKKLNKKLIRMFLK